MSRRASTSVRAHPRKSTRRVTAPSSPPPATRWTSTEVELIVARFRLRAGLRFAWLQHLRRESTRSASGAVVAGSEIAAILADADSPAAERTWREGDAATQGWLGELRGIEDKLSQPGGQGELARIARVFGLGPAERDLLEASFAVAADPALARSCGYLQDDAGRAYLTEDVAARLYDHGRCGRWSAESAVFRWELITRREGAIGEPAALTCDVQIRHWIMGAPVLDPVLVGLAQLQFSPEPLSQWPVAEIAAWLQETTPRLSNPNLRVIVSGAVGSGRRSFAAAVARELKLPLLLLDADAIDDAAWPVEFLHAQRHAFLATCALAWTGESLARRLWPARSATFPVQFCLCVGGAEPPRAAGVAERRLVLPPATAEDRLRLWRGYVPSARTWPAKALRHLAERHAVNPGDIVHAGRRGVTTPDGAAQAARESARARFDGLVQRLECPYRWPDLVVSPPVKEALEAFVFEAQHRHLFWEKPAHRDLFPQGRGLAALLSGTPGTGKTMAAQVIAAELGQDLFRVNLAHLVSKWVGETAKNVDHLLREAAALDAVVFFDEAEAAFARRSVEMNNAQDKFANTDAAHLLQAIEHYPGVVLLATNLKGNIDPAFFRRLRFVIEFPKPEPALQRELWTRLLVALGGAEAGRKLAPALARLSDTVEATGAQIKYAVLNATFFAQREKTEISAGHLLRGLQSELDKEGRGIALRDREKILGHG